MEIYLDNSATTKPCQEAVEAAGNALCECWGNPSSLHSRGVAAASLLDSAREAVAGALGAADEEVYFSPSGTAASNTALFGAARLARGHCGRIVTTALEHPCSARVFDKLASEGFEIVRLPAAPDGSFTHEQLFEAVTPDTVLISVMAVNNELGTIFPVDLLRKAADRAGAKALIHVDAVQAFGKIPVNVKKIGCDLLTVSAHKIHGPKGAGALYVRKGLHLSPYILGGGQEKGLFSGTEPVPAIAGFGAAVKALPDLNEGLRRAASLSRLLRERAAQIPGVYINSGEDALPYIVNLSVTGVPSEVMVNFLSGEGICISSGSACHRGRRSDVLTAVGLSPERIDSALRVSFSRYNTPDDVTAFCDGVTAAVKRFRRQK